MVHLAGLHTVVRVMYVSAAPSQLILLQVGPRRCLQRLRVAPFWFFQLLTCVGGIVIFVAEFLAGLCSVIRQLWFLWLCSGVRGLAVVLVMRAAMTLIASWAD